MKTLFTATLACLVLSSVASGSTGEMYGYGSKAAALGNTMLGAVNDPFTTYYNPAANSTHPGLQLTLGIAYAKPKFLDIKNVVINNSVTSAETHNVNGDVDTGSYEDFLEQMFGGSLNFGEKFKNLTIGVMAAVPLTHIAYLDTGDPFLPEYFNYRSRTQRPQIYGSISASPMSWLHLAMGIALTMNLSANTTAYLTGNSGSFSHQQFASTIKPGAAPYFSAYVNKGDLQLGGTIRLPARSKVSIDTNANAGLLANLASLPLVLNSSATLYYDPLEIDSAFAYKLTDRVWATAEVDWLQYKAFEAPDLAVVNIASGFAINNSISTAPPMKNIFIPKGGLEYRLDTASLRAGYMFRPSPVTDNTGNGNFVDPTSHIFTLGVGLDLQKAGLTEKQIFLDMHAQYHLLVHQDITKSANNEANNSTQAKIGAPGYTIGGSIYGGGFSVSMAF